MLRIPAGAVCPGSCPRSVCNQPRSRVRPGPVPAPGWKRGSGSGGSQSRGAQPCERLRERGGGGCPARSWGTAEPGDTRTRPRHGPAAPRPAAGGSGLRGQAGPAAGGVGRWSGCPETPGEGLRQPDAGPGQLEIRHHVPAAEPAAIGPPDRAARLRPDPGAVGGPGRAVPRFPRPEGTAGPALGSLRPPRGLRGAAEPGTGRCSAPAPGGDPPEPPQGPRDHAVSDPRPAPVAQPGWGDRGNTWGGSDEGRQRDHFGRVSEEQRAETSLEKAQAGGLIVITWSLIQNFVGVHPHGSGSARGISAPFGGGTRPLYQ